MISGTCADRPSTARCVSLGLTSSSPYWDTELRLSRLQPELPPALTSDPKHWRNQDSSTHTSTCLGTFHHTVCKKNSSSRGHTKYTSVFFVWGFKCVSVQYSIWSRERQEERESWAKLSGELERVFYLNHQGNGTCTPFILVIEDIWLKQCPF